MSYNYKQVMMGWTVSYSKFVERSLSILMFIYS